MRQRLRTLWGTLVPGLLLTLLFCTPAATMQGARDGLRLWADAVLPALLPFFVVTTLLSDCGALRAAGPLLRPVCRLLRLPDALGGALLAAWLSGAPNGHVCWSRICRMAASRRRRPHASSPQRP